MSNIMLTAVIMLIAYVALFAAVEQIHSIGISFGLLESIVISGLYGIAYIFVSGHIVYTAILIVIMNLVKFECRRGPREIINAFWLLEIGAWSTICIPLAISGSDFFSDNLVMAGGIIIFAGCFQLLVAFLTREKPALDQEQTKKAKRKKAKKPQEPAPDDFVASAVPPEQPETNTKPEAWQVIVGVGAFAVIAILVVWGVSEAILYIPRP